MSVETSADLVERLQAAATAAIEDVRPAIEAAGPRRGLLTLQLEVNSKGQVVGGVAWPRLRVNLSKLLGVSGRD